MKTTLAVTLNTLMAVILFGGSASGQQTPASGAQQAPASGTPQTPTPKTSTAPTAKSGQSTTTKSAPKTARSTAPLTLKTDKDKNSYAIGMNIGKGLQRDSVDVDPAILLRGLKDAMSGGTTLLTEQEAQTLLMALQNEVRKKQMELRQQASVVNKKEGEAFLAENKTKEGVVTLPSGLQYKILKEGDGPRPSADDAVICNYRGTLLNGTEFDSSYKRGQPATFAVKQVIKGWTEALQLMPVGSKWLLFVPSDLAYGERGAGGVIGPNSTIVFEMELVSIQPKETKPETKPEMKPETKPEQKPAEEPKQPPKQTP
jgi:FKBP-type peptidyl-prolyl cis-trans isomerase